ncbi:MAG: hypothetical protein H6719_29280 [Sandaracinaceae bacterium]|nr:hypothetical protein [Sandaracinaceae bacterium]
MRRRFQLLGLVLFGALAAMVAGCSANPKSDCLSVCNEQNDRMCNGRDGTTNCDAECSSAETEYDDAIETANRFGCRSEFDSFYGCLVGGDPCVSDRCNAEITAVQSCSTTYCAANPTDPECGAP